MHSQNSAILSDAQKQALKWLARLRDTQCSHHDKQEFAYWLALTPENAHAYSQVSQFWSQTSELQGAVDGRLKNARNFAKATQSSHRRRKSVLILSLVLLSVGISQPEFCLKLTSQYYQTTKGQILNVSLSDGSQITLNTNTQVRVADMLGYRKAWLETGEAWFSIHHNEKNPFEVFAGHGSIRDIGTQFNVMTDNNHTFVMVQEGEVAIHTDQVNRERLVANQQSSFNDKGQLANITSADANATGAWRSGILIFKHQSLPDVLKELSRYHNVAFEISDMKLQTMIFSGRLSTTDLNENLTTLSSAIGVKVVQLTPEHFLIKSLK
jgi:transmembrane sensor